MEEQINYKVHYTNVSQVLTTEEAEDFTLWYPHTQNSLSKGAEEATVPMPWALHHPTQLFCPL